MLFRQEECELFCIHCQEETPHIVGYVNQSLLSIECQVCHSKMDLDVDAMEEFHHYILERFSSKPTRLTNEAKQNLNQFLKSLPMRIISKPFRFGAEYTTLTKEVKHLQNEQTTTENDNNDTE